MRETSFLPFGNGIKSKEFYSSKYSYERHTFKFYFYWKIITKDFYKIKEFYSKNSDIFDNKLKIEITKWNEWKYPDGIMII